MKNFAIVDKNGEPTNFILNCPDEVQPFFDVVSQIRRVEFPPEANRETIMSQYFWKDGWKRREARPSKYHYWDYNLEIWIPNLEEAKTSKMVEVNLFRDERLKNNKNGIHYKGYVFDNNDKMRGNVTEVLNLLNSGVPIPENFTFRTKDNINIPFNSDDIKNLASLILFFKNSCYQYSWTLKDQIESLMDIESVEAFDISQGWPE